MQSVHQHTSIDVGDDGPSQTSNPTYDISDLVPSPPSAAGRFDLPTTPANRSTPVAYDLIYDTAAGSYGWLTPHPTGHSGFVCHWLSPPFEGRCSQMDSAGLELRVEKNTLTIIAADVPHPEDCWWLPAALNRSPEEFDSDATERSASYRITQPSVEETRISPLVDGDELYYDGDSSSFRTPTGTTDDLTCRRIRSESEVSEFLDSPIVDHRLGDVQGWKAAFAAVRDDQIVAIAIMGRPSSRKLDPNSGSKHSEYGEVTMLTRYAAHPNRPENTATWLIAKARDWAAHEGYETFLTYAGVDDNEGIIYQAAGLRSKSKSDMDGDGWTSRNGREGRHDYELQPFTATLNDCRPIEDLSRSQYGTSVSEDGPSVTNSSQVTFATQTAPKSATSQTQNDGGIIRINRPTESPDPSNEAILQTRAATESDLASEEIQSHMTVADACFGVTTDSSIVALAFVTRTTPPLWSADERRRASSAPPEMRITAVAVAPSACKHPETKVGALLGHIRQWSSLEGCSSLSVDLTGSYDCPNVGDMGPNSTPARITYNACKNTNIPVNPVSSLPQ